MVSQEIITIGITRRGFETRARLNILPRIRENLSPIPSLAGASRIISKSMDIHAE